MIRYALVVGIAQYDHFRNLDKAATDAEAVAQLLEQHKYEVTRLPRKLVSENQWAIDSDKRLTATQLSAELKSFLNERATRQPAVVYFASHGFRTQDKFIDDKQIGYLATSDSAPQGQNAFPMDALNAFISKSDLGSLVMLLDCCHAGTLIEQHSLLQATQSVIGQKRNYCLLAACRDFERAREGERHGLFTAAVLQGLSAENTNATNGEITSNSLFEFVARKLQGSGQEVVQQTGSSILIPLVTLSMQKEEQRRLQQADVSAEHQQKGRFFLHKQDIDTFTGRAEELQQLKSQLLSESEEERGSIFGISGSGGLGKTTLAFRFATLHQHEFPDGVIGLPVDGKTVYEVAYDFARLDGKEIEEDEDISPISVMQELFAHRRMLLIFDNVDNADLKVLQPGGLCSVIVTTRDRSIHGSFGIPKEAMIDLSVFPESDARKLLRAIVGKRVDDEPEAADRIFKMTENLPLALEIAGYTLQQEAELSLSRYAEYLKAEEDRLEELQHGDDIGLNVTASLEVSLKFLEALDIDLFACLSVCAKDGFSLKTVVEACGFSNRKESRRRLQKLRRFSLLNSVGEERYTFHTLVRIYAQALAQERNLWDAATKRHAEYFLRFVENNDVEDPEVAKKIIEDFEDILQAAHWLRKHAVSNELKESAYQFALDLRPFLLKYSYSKQAIELMMGFQVWAEQLRDWYADVRFKIQHAKYLSIEEKLAEAESVLEKAQDSIDRISDPIQRKESQLKQLNSLGGVLRKQKKFDKAIAIFNREIAIAEASEDEAQAAIGWYGLGIVFLERKDKEAAISSFERSIALDDEARVDRFLVIRLNYLGKLLQQDKVEKAIATFKRSIAISETFSDQTSLAISVSSLGGALQKQGSFEAAKVAFERSVVIRRALGNQKRLAISLNRLGGLLQQHGRLEEAVTVFNQEIDIDRKVSDQKQLVIGLNCLGRALQKQKKTEEAITVFKEQIEIAKVLDDPRQVSTGWNSLANACQEQNNFDAAIEAFQHVVDIEESIGNQQQLVFTYNQFGEALRKKGDLDSAITVFRRGISLAESLKNNQKNLAVGLHCLGKALAEKGDWETMTTAFLRSILIAERINDKKQTAMGYISIRRAFQEQGDKKRLVVSLKDKLVASQDLTEKKQLAIILNRLGRVFQKQNNFEDAIFTFQHSVDIAESLNEQKLLINSLKRLEALFDRQAKPTEAVSALEHEIRVYEESKDQQQLAVALNRLGGWKQRQQNFEEAISIFRREVDIDRDLDDKRQLVIGLNCLGRALQQKKSFEEAIATFEEQIQVAEALKDCKQVATGWGCLGNVHHEQKSFEAALAACQHEIRIEGLLGNQQQLVFAYNRIGHIYKDSDSQLSEGGDNLESAADAFIQSIEITKKIDDKMNWTIGLDCLGSVLRRQEKLEEAAAIFEEEISIAETLENVKQLAIGWNSLGEVSREQGHAEQPIFAFLRSVVYNEILEDGKQLHSIWKRLGDIITDRSNAEAVISAVQRFQSVAGDLTDPLYKAIAMHALGKVYNEIRKLDDAESILRESQELLNKINNRKQLLKVLKTLVETYERKHDWEKAEQILRISYNETEKTQDISLQEKIVRKLGKICTRQGTEEKLAYAKSYFRRSVKLSTEMNDPIRLAQSYKAWGDVLKNTGKLEDSVLILREGFEKLISDIESHEQKNGRYVGGLRKVTGSLGQALISLHRREEALKYCDHASFVTGPHDTWTNLRNELSSAPKEEQKSQTPPAKP